MVGGDEAAFEYRWGSRAEKELTKRQVLQFVSEVRLYRLSGPPFFLRDSRASETRARVKITPREKRRHAAGTEKNACRLFSRGAIFTRARVSLALLSLRKNGGLLVVYVFTAFCLLC